MAASSIRLIAGLGNPGQQYAQTRHNAGFWFVDSVARHYAGGFRADAKFFGEICRIRVARQECWLLKPGTFMNRSGQSVASLASYYKIPAQQILVVHDELDLPAGSIRLKQGGGHGGHNGLRDIISATGEREFWRLRVGIGHPGDSRRVVDYVLGRPSKDDETLIRHALSRAEALLPEIVDGEFQRVMNQLHGPA